MLRGDDKKVPEKVGSDLDSRASLTYSYSWKSGMKNKLRTEAHGESSKSPETLRRKTI